ncbi:MAG: arginine--tRNA ligase [Halolamina sp.]
MFVEFRSEVEAAVAGALATLSLPTDDLGIERPPAEMEATLASSVAFRLAGEVGAPPPEVAADIADAVDLSGAEYVVRVDTEGPYVNFYPGDAYEADTLAAAAGDDGYGHRPARDASVVVEHTSANPTGPIHVGRARNPIIGDAVANLLEYAGYDVDRHYYVNDAGRQMAVFTWAYETFDESDLPEPDRDKPDYDLVRYYRKGNAFLEESPEAEVEAAEAEIESIMQGLEAGEEATHERVGEVVDTVLEGMQTTLGRLPAEFDEFVKETRFMRNGDADAVVDRLQASDHAERDDGAWVLDLADWDIDKEFVFVRSDGTSLYTTRDLAHHEWKFEGYDRAVTVLGEDQRLHASQLEAALETLGNDTDQLDSIFYSWVNLPGGEGMSTRQGTGVDIDDLLDEAVARAREEVQSRLDDRTRGDLTEDDVDRIARQVGVGAVRYDIVSKQRSKTITFEWDRALDFEAQSAPYVQYVHARCCGILEEAAADPEPEAVDADLLETDAETALLGSIARFPAVVEEAAAELEPHQVATFTRTLAERFNAFYRECPVLDAADPDLRRSRLALVAAARHTVANALGILGVASPETM